VVLVFQIFNLEPNADNLPVAPHETILPLNPGETPTVPPAPFRGIEAGAGFCFAGSLVSMFTANLAMWGKRLLVRYSPYEIERCADRRREFDALDRRQLEFFLSIPTSIYMVPIALYIWGMRCISSSSRCIPTHIAVLVVTIVFATSVFDLWCYHERSRPALGIDR